LRNKYVAVADTILSNNIDLLVVTESWHRSSSDVAVRRSAPPGYSFLDCPRMDAEDADCRGGGIVIYHKEDLRVQKIAITTLPTTFEVLAASITSSRGPLTALAVYRPGSTPPTPAFFDEFTSLLEQFALYNTQVIVAGDLNLHLEDNTLPATSEFRSITDQFGLTQHVDGPTHRCGTVILSLTITKRKRK
jgi:hypothetical protein